MKARLLFLLLLGQMFFSYGQIQINQITPTAVSNGLNVNLLVTAYSGAGYLSHNYTTTGNTINLSVCYWINATAPVFQISNDFIIPVPNNTNYTINVSVVYSTSQINCNNFSIGPTATAYYLDVDDFEKIKEDYALFPNPTDGKVDFRGNAASINEISLFDNLGRLVKQTKNSIGNSLDLKNLNDGVYLVKIETEFGVINQKIILKNKS